MDKKVPYHPVINCAGFVVPDEFAEEYEARYGNDAWLYPELAAELIAERRSREERDGGYDGNRRMPQTLFGYPIVWKD